MAAKVEFWDADTFIQQESEREYERYEVTAISKAEESWGRDSGVVLQLFVDALTGVVTTDVGLYERSLKN